MRLPVVMAEGEAGKNCPTARTDRLISCTIETDDCEYQAWSLGTSDISLAQDCCQLTKATRV
jgi:hypothetical protein